MRILLKILLSGLLLVLAVAVGTEVVALHRYAQPLPAQGGAPVVVRKSAQATTPPKKVRLVPGRLPAPARPKAWPIPHKKAPAG